MAIYSHKEAVFFALGAGVGAAGEKNRSRNRKNYAAPVLRFYIGSLLGGKYFTTLNMSRSR